MSVKEEKRFSNCAQGLSTLFFFFLLSFLAVCAAKRNKKRQIFLQYSLIILNENNSMVLFGVFYGGLRLGSPPHYAFR